jgi:hypothetical protein
MKAAARGCLELLVVWAIVGGVSYAAYFQGRFTPPGPFYGSLAAGMLMACAWGLIRNGLQARGQVELIRRSQAGQFPRDGASYAAIGVAVPLGESLHTPFQKKRCVLYSYDLSKTEKVRIKRAGERRTETRRAVYLTGQASPGRMGTHAAGSRL